ncbi:hypothetical protein M011DRAFT_524042 [Sporormia fimetaria CBS 119925]|uniref:RNA polymerase I-specific transcription initiation factor RRN6-like protein n=1 Tax=Sporormia fimetaria CBS 119925 TaxID=1340428 RepID=A0A6A6VJ49_9PLEO|nr:hypothetical protein M011DRAFT_524042 [Sporormia fimetaria CBS 119925]
MDKPHYDLNYGHLGQPSYHIEDGSWTFDRNTRLATQLRQLGSWSVALRPTSDHADTDDQNTSTRVHGGQLQAKSIGRTDPGLTSVIELLPKLNLVSAAITSAVKTFDPASGSLLSFGTVSSSKYYRHVRRIAAVATGESGNILRLAVLGRERHGWGNDRSIWLELPSISGEDNAYWAKDAAPIKQICFAQVSLAQVEDRSAFLAVRFPAVTVIFRPTFSSDRKHAVRSTLYDLPASTIDPRPILSISAEQTGGEPHADVTFNPGYQRQLGIVGQKGTWSVWDIEGGLISPYELKCVALGSIKSDPHGDRLDDEDDGHGDGWARIMWIGDVNTILVCDRRRLRLYGIRAGEPESLKCFQPASPWSQDCILDLKPHPLNAQLFFVLTSTHLYLMTAFNLDHTENGSVPPPSGSVVLSWTHFRGLEDITLQMTVSAVSDQECDIFVTSRLNDLVTRYQFGQDELDPARSVSTADPSIPQLGSLNASGSGPSGLSHLHFEPAAYYTDERFQPSGQGSDYQAAGIQFYRTFAMATDGTTYQSLFYLQDANSISPHNSALYVEPPAWNAAVQRNTGVSQSATTVSELDDFIVQDGFETAETRPHIAKNRSKVWFRDSMSDSGNGVGSAGDRARMDLSSLVAELESEYHTAQSGDNLGSGSGEISDVIDLVKQRASSSENVQGTLLDFAPQELTVHDIDLASSQLEALSEPAQTRIRSIDYQAAANISRPDGEKHTLSTLYERLLETFIAPLPSTAPRRIRQRKEHLSRRIAAEVSLSSLRLGSSVDDTVPSVQTAAEQRDLAESTHAFSFSRLSQHLQITKPPPEVPAGIDRIRSDWVPGTDLTSYEWQATEATSLDLVDEGDAEQRRKNQERLKRESERLLKRQKRQSVNALRDYASQPLGAGDMRALASSPPPMIPALGSQPQILSQSQSQSQDPFGGSGIVQTQVEPGRHGGRPAKKPKKSRVSGF